VGAAFVEPAVRLTPFVAAATFIVCMRAHHVDTAFHLARRTGLLTALFAGVAVIEIALGVTLIPRFGYMGPAFAGLAAAAIGWVLAFGVARRLQRLRLPLAETASVLLATSIMALVLVALPVTGDVLALGLAIVAGGVAYGAVVVGLNVMGLRSMVLGRLLRRFRRPALIAEP
jgi:O-antigen/teichoic acid export membrane protein